MSDKYDFAEADDLKRERDVEGTIGVLFKMTDTVKFLVLAQSDANPRYRELGPKRIREIKRRANAGATPEELDALWAAYFADCHVIGWEDVLNSKDEQVPFSRAACIAWMIQHPRSIKLLDRWTEDETNFRRSKNIEVVDQLKND